MIGFRVYIAIEQFEYDPKVGTHKKKVTEPNVKTAHGDWTLKCLTNDLDEADQVIAGMVHIARHDDYCCGPRRRHMIGCRRALRHLGKCSRKAA